MALSFDRPWLLLLIPVLALVLLAVAWLKKTRNVISLAMRFGLVTLLVIGAAGPKPYQAEAEVLPRQVILLDGSASVNQDTLTAVQNALAVLVGSAAPTFTLGGSAASPVVPPVPAGLPAAITSYTINELDNVVIKVARDESHPEFHTSRSKQTSR